MCHQYSVRHNEAHTGTLTKQSGKPVKYPLREKGTRPTLNKKPTHQNSTSTSCYLYPVVFLDTELVNIIIIIENSEPKPSRFVGVLFSHYLDIHHLAILFNHIQDILFGCVWREAAQKHLLCPLVSLGILFLTRNSTFSLNLCMHIIVLKEGRRHTLIYSPQNMKHS